MKERAAMERRIIEEMAMKNIEDEKKINEYI